MTTLPWPCRPAAAAGSDALLLFAGLKEGKGPRVGVMKNKLLAVLVASAGRSRLNVLKNTNICSHFKKEKDGRSKDVRVLMFKLQDPAAGSDGLLKKPFKEIMLFPHKMCQRERRAASACGTQRRDYFHPQKSDKCRRSFCQMPCVAVPISIKMHQSRLISLPLRNAAHVRAHTAMATGVRTRTVAALCPFQCQSLCN